MRPQNPLLMQVRSLIVRYKTRSGTVSAVDDVSFDIYKGEILGLVGESGSGKSTMGKALMRMLPRSAQVSGELIFQGEDVMKFTQAQLRDFRGKKISMIFQDPMTSLNPVQRVSEHVVEAIQVHEPKTTAETALSVARELIERLGIARRRIIDYPHQLSGGMRQRVMIGLGLVLNANLIIADEATTSLDVIVEAKLVDQLRQIREDFGVTLLVITHNIALVAQLCDRVAVMYAGQIAEIGPVEQIFDQPLHPYTKGLLQSVPSIQLDEKEQLYKMAGEPPSLADPPTGCRFHPRCPYVMEICPRIDPRLEEAAPGRLVHCWLYQDHPDKETPTIEVEE
jgi:peptide/nickel transport system ATP-binding protein